MRELFFIVLVFARPDASGVDMTVLTEPRYTSGAVCVADTLNVLREVQRLEPLARGALCYTIDEISGFAPGSLHYHDVQSKTAINHCSVHVRGRRYRCISSRAGD